MSKPIVAKKEESFFAKEKRLKARKQSFKMTYRKGLFYNTWAYKTLIDYLNQPDVLVRVNSGGELDDGKAFIQITIEGFTPSENGI